MVTQSTGTAPRAGLGDPRAELEVADPNLRLLWGLGVPAGLYPQAGNGDLPGAELLQVVNPEEPFVLRTWGRVGGRAELWPALLTALI